MTNSEDEAFITAAWLNKQARLKKAALSATPEPENPESKFVSEIQLLANMQKLYASTKSVPSDPHTQPQRMGNYIILNLVGVGGCAFVYRALDERLQREVAIKVPLPHRLLDETARARFVQEAQAVAKLDHPYIVPAYEACDDGSIPFIAYAFCDGPTLAAWLAEHGTLTNRMAAAVLLRLADAVQFSHDRGILHRDIKPANVLLFPTATTAEDELPFWPRLTDFGLAKVLESAISNTGSSVVIGTPFYMAPEQISSDSEEYGKEADVFGLGAVLYEALSGKTPFTGGSIMDVLETIREGKIPHVRKLQPNVDPDLATICHKALSLKPSDRYRSASEMKADLQRYLSHERIHAKKPNLWQQLRWFSESPARVNEAASFSVLCHLAVLMWVASWPVRIVFHWRDYGTKLDELLPYTVPLEVMHVLFIFLGWQLGKKRKWLAAVSTCLAALLSLFLLFVLTGLISPPYPSIYANQRDRDLVFSLLFTIFAAQTALCACAWRALAQRPLQRNAPNPRQSR